MSQFCYNVSMGDPSTDIRTVKGEKCLSCSGKIGYFPSSNRFECLSCKKPYNPSENKAKEARQKFWASPKGREIQAAYFRTEKGTTARKNYQKTVKGQLTSRRYYYSDKGQEAHQKHQDKVRSYKTMDIWLKANPGKTITDYFSEHPTPQEPVPEPQDNWTRCSCGHIAQEHSKDYKCEECACTHYDGGKVKR